MEEEQSEEHGHLFGSETKTVEEKDETRLLETKKQQGK